MHIPVQVIRWIVNIALRVATQLLQYVGILLGGRRFSADHIKKCYQHIVPMFTVSCDRLLTRHPTSSIVMKYCLFWRELFFLTYASLIHAKLRVNIVTIGNIYPNVPGAIPYTGPAIETGIQHIQSTYGEFFHFTHTYLFDRRMSNCVEFATNSDHVAGQWYYSRRDASDLVIFLFAGTIHPLTKNLTSW